MEKYRLLIVLFAVFVFSASGQDPSPSSASPTQLWKSTWVDILKKDLLTNYDKYARPSQQYNATNLDIKMTLIHVDIDEVKSVMTVFGWMKMSWTDEKLKWNISDYGDVKYITTGDIWKPALIIFNSARGSSIDVYSDTACQVDNEGNVEWMPPVEFHTFCELDIREWPLDKQVCSLLIGGKTYRELRVNLGLEGAGIDSKLLTDNHEWEIIDMSGERIAENVEFQIVSKRRAPIYKNIVYTPVFVITLMTLGSFWLPPGSGEKLILNGISALTVIIFLIYFALQLPVSSSHAPYIVLFYSSALYLISISTILAVIAINIATTKFSRPVPWFIKAMLDSQMSNVLGLKLMKIHPKPIRKSTELQEEQCEEISVSDAQKIFEEKDTDSKAENWFLFAIVIDRVSFIIYAFIFIILTICYF